MSLMEKKALLNLIIWTKRVSAFVAFGVWISIIYTVIQTSAPFMEQAPYCMAGTMLVFGVLTGIFKGLEKWEVHINTDER